MSTQSLNVWFRCKEVTILNSTDNRTVVVAVRKSVLVSRKLLKAMSFRLTCDGGEWPYLTTWIEKPREKIESGDPPLIQKIWSFLKKRLERADNKLMSVVIFNTLANDIILIVYWREHAEDEMKAKKTEDILIYLSPCWERSFFFNLFSVSRKSLFELFITKLLNIPINLLLALILVFPLNLFDLGTAFLFSRGEEILRLDGYLTLLIMTHGSLTIFPRLMKFVDPPSMGKSNQDAESNAYRRKTQD